jgi:hypothetical protein
MNNPNMLHDGRLSLPVMSKVIAIVWLSVIFTLYLSPSKYATADLLAALLLVVTIGVFGLGRSGIMTAIKPLAWLLTMLLYVVVFGLSRPELDMVPYLRGLLIGFVPYLLLYLMFRNQEGSNIPLLVVGVFLIPGLIHLTFMYLDMFRAIQQGDVPFLSSSRHGLLEYIKDTPRVGRRYLSLALLHLLFAGLMMSWYLRRTPTRYLAWGLSSFSVLSLFLLDARAAYASVLIGGGLLVIAIGPSRAWQSMKSLMPTGYWGRWLLVSLLVASVGIGYSAGKSRWVSSSDSFSAAVHDVFDSEVELTQRPFVNANYWSAPIVDIDACYLEGHFRCRIDQSAYLRMAWLLSGLQGLVEHPVGIGYSEDYMARLWGVVGEQGKYQRTDSFLLELIVSFGVVGIMVYAWLVWGLLHSLRQTIRSGNPSIVLIAACGLIFICLGRALVDPLNEGFWRYLMALLGMYYGLLHSNKQQIMG